MATTKQTIAVVAGLSLFYIYLRSRQQASSPASAQASASSSRQPLEIDLPKLPYAYDALEPYIDTATMQVHHGKHHQAYTTKATGAINAMLKSDAEKLIPANLSNKESAVPLMRHLLANLSKLPKEHQGTIRNHGGGYLNHIDFWASMTPDADSRKVPEKLGEAIKKSFGSVENFNSEFTKTGVGIFGKLKSFCCLFVFFIL